MKCLHMALDVLKRCDLDRPDEGIVSNGYRPAYPGAARLEQECAEFTGGQAALGATALGAATGGAMAYGLWTVVSVVGVSATGTPIAALSGIAAHNAILAFIGGGAIAAGGGGMAAGSMLLASALWVPALVAAPIATHLLAAKLEKRILALTTETERLRQGVATMEDTRSVAERARGGLRMISSDLAASLCRTRRSLYRWGLLSRMACSVRVLVGRPYANRAQMRAVRELDTCVGDFVIRFRTLCEDGRAMRA